MPLPISRTALDKLGVRLAAADQPAEEDLALWQLVAGHCQQVLSGVQAQLEELGYEGPTPRVKTTGTLVDKLRRERPMRLSQVQDIAGARVIVAGRIEQDEAVTLVCDLYESRGCAVKVSDRRVAHSHGYRAVHVIVVIDQVNVEIQVRTELQDTWAQIIEELADTWGRDIRYGGEPASPETRITAGEFTSTRSQALYVLKGLSDLIAQVETGRVKLGEISRLLAQVGDPAERVTEAQAANLTMAGAFGVGLELTAAQAPAEGYSAPPLPDGWRAATGKEALEIIRDVLTWAHEVHDQAAEATRISEHSLRDTLQLIAHATEQEG